MYLRISSGSLKARRFRVPSTSLRPTCEKVRAAFFNSLFSLINFENRNFLDIFSGSGAFAFESVSRGFQRACAVEIDLKAADQIRESSKELGLNELVKVFNGDAFSIDLDCFSGMKFSAIYIDPPYVIGEKIPDLLERITSSDIIDEVCVICVEGSSLTSWSKTGWSDRNKKFGDTHLSFFYNWEA
jgi:16S rRNA (guanine966-N2)-methyltransferase